jgi:hypothetical protein
MDEYKSLTPEPKPDDLAALNDVLPRFTAERPIDHSIITHEIVTSTGLRFGTCASCAMQAERDIKNGILGGYSLVSKREDEIKIVHPYWDFDGIIA